MSLLLLEALLALGIGIFIVWWTMFSGRPRERDDASQDDKPGQGSSGDAVHEAHGANDGSGSGHGQGQGTGQGSADGGGSGK